MTIEEKRRLVHEHCSDTLCSECPLRCQEWVNKHPTHGCLVIGDASEGELDRALEIFACNQKESNAVNHPSHYNQGKYECIEVMVETFGIEAAKNFCLLNAFKYIWRAGEKNGREDIEKAIWYLNKYLEVSE